MQKYKIRKQELKKQLAIRKPIVLKGRKFGNIFNEQFDIILCCIVYTVYTVLLG